MLRLSCFACFITTIFAFHPVYDGNRERAYHECVDICAEITPSAGPRVVDGTNLYLVSNFIYWWVREEGLEFGFNRHMHSPDLGSHPGFKVGIGYHLPQDGWDFLMQYTWLNADGSNTATQITPLWAPIGLLNRARAQWSLHFNNFDFEIGRNFYLSKDLKYRPFVGAKGGWHDETYSVGYDRIHFDSFFWYLGMRTGFTSQWHLSKRLSLCSDAAISANWSHFKLERNTITRTFHTVFPVLELAIGLQWDTFFSDGDYHFASKLSWEEQIWWGHNALPTFSTPQNQLGNLTLQGINLQLRLDF